MSLENIRNGFDYFIRSRFTYTSEISTQTHIPKIELKFQSELNEFFTALELDKFLRNHFCKAHLKVVDVGARNFSSGIAIETYLRNGGIESEVHGIEIDAHRRMRDLKTRAAWGRYFASKMQNGHFYAMDFLSWKNPVDVLFCLNPFVSKTPHVRWGLPLRLFDPKQYFAHAARLCRGGVLVLSSPTENELKIATKLIEAEGFIFRKEGSWFPKSESYQQQQRLGRVFISR